MIRKFEHHTIAELLELDQSIALALYEMGIPFLECGEKRFLEACRTFKKDPGKVFQYILIKWEKARNYRLDRFANYSALELVSELESAHRQFNTQQLPFLKEVIATIPVEEFCNIEIGTDLKLIFPLFCQDFVHHIQEEEQQIFSHIRQLDSYLTCKTDSVHAWEVCLQSSPVNQSLIQHHLEDDDMEGIRTLTDQYTVDSKAKAGVRELYRQLQHFEKELQYHAAVENTLLFPKVLQMQEGLTKQIQVYSTYN